MENLPAYPGIICMLATGITLLLFYRATNQSRPAIIMIVLWLILQGIVSATGFYTVTNSVPPRFLLSIVPPLILIAALFSTGKGRRFIDGMQLRTLTLLHIIRIPVEICLYTVFLHKAIPQVMTFEGRNFDILSGLSAPVVFYFAFAGKTVNRSLLLCWNLICLGFLVNIVVIAILSAPFSFQRLGFEQPNVAVLHFPFVWLPCCIVPIVLLSHLAAIRQLIKNKEYNMKAHI